MDIETCTGKIGAFFIHLLTFTNTLVYSVVRNQSCGFGKTLPILNEYKQTKININNKSQR